MKVHIKTNNIKWKTKDLKCLPKEMGTIKVQGPKLQMIIKMEKLVDLFVVFAKIIHYVRLFLKINLKNVVQKMVIEGALQTLK